MSTAFLYDQQIEETPQFWTDEMANEFLESQEETEKDYLDNYYSQYDNDDDAALEYYSLCCAYGEEF